MMGMTWTLKGTGMVTFAQIQDAKPHMWFATGDQWQKRAVYVFTEAQTLRSYCHIIKESWSDSSTANHAVKSLDKLIEKLIITSTENRAMAMVCKGLGHALAISQDSLSHAVRIAENVGLRITDNGAVSAPPAGVPTDRVRAFDYASQDAKFLIDTAIESASKADRAACDAFGRLADAVKQTDRKKALDDLNMASHLEMTIISGMLPSGNAENNSLWWKSLGSDNQLLLMGAATSELECLAGIPTGIKKELQGSDKYNRARAAGWAEVHWNDGSGNAFGDNNCTIFASETMARGGHLRQYRPEGPSDDAWNRNRDRGPINYGYTDSWVKAPDLKDFLTDHGGTVVSHQEARPGDLLFFENSKGVHHTAVVTGNIDGDIRYTQHSEDRVDASLNERNAVTESTDTVYIIRVNPDW